MEPLPLQLSATWSWAISPSTISDTFGDTGWLLTGPHRACHQVQNQSHEN